MLLLFDMDDSDLLVSIDSLGDQVDTLIVSIATTHHLNLQAYEGSPSLTTIRFRGIILGTMV